MLKSAQYLYLVIVFTGTTLAATQSRQLVKLYEITGSNKVQQKIPQQKTAHSDHRRYVNVFTNIPQVGEVLRSAYEETRGNNGSRIPLSALRVKTTYNAQPSAQNINHLVPIKPINPPKPLDDDALEIVPTLPRPSALVQEVIGRPRVAKSLDSIKFRGVDDVHKTPKSNTTKGIPHITMLTDTVATVNGEKFFAVDEEPPGDKVFDGTFKLNDTKHYRDGVRVRGNFTVMKTTLAVPKGSLKGMQDLQEKLPSSLEMAKDEHNETLNQITTTPSPAAQSKGRGSRMETSMNNNFDHNKITLDPMHDWTPIDGVNVIGTAKSNADKESSYEDNDYYVTFQTKQKPKSEEDQVFNMEDLSVEKSTRLPRSSSENVLSRPAESKYYETDVQSEYGVVVPQKSSEVVTQTINFKPNDNSETRGLSDWIQKIPKTFLSSGENGSYVDGVANRVHHLLKSYMPKLYQTKYHSDGVEEQESKKFSDKKKKFVDGFFPNSFLSLFTIVQFPNSQCLASSGLGNYDGICYHQAECAELNGTAMGRCANGYGVCCAFRNTCGGHSGSNCTYFESPGYPNYYPGTGGILPPTPSVNVTGVDPRMNASVTSSIPRQLPATPSLSCGFQVYKISPFVQQMRIDFIDFELRGPTNGSCVNERLVISGQNVNNPVPMLCGYNTGQHIYVDVSNMTGPLQLAIQAASMEQRRFKIKICQLIQVPNSMNCLQYYTGVTGVLTSFNYEQASAMNRSIPGYFNNLNYAICIRKEMGYCTVTYTNIQPNGVENQFQLSNLDAGRPIIPPGQAGAEIFNCPDDFIAVNGIRLCGDKLNDGSVIVDFKKNAPITDNSAGPIVLPVRTNGATTGRGFKLFYTQNKCTT